MTLTLKLANKGLLKILESVIAILMILTFVVIYFGSKESFPEFESINRGIRGYYSLKVLDQTNKLRSDVIANNTLNIENNLKPLIPGEINFQVFVCQKDCGKPSVQSDKMISVVYLVAGDINNFQPRQILLYMW